MATYKVTMTKTVFVEAESKEEAEECALDDDYMMMDEKIVDVVKSTKREMRTMMIDGWRGGK